MKKTIIFLFSCLTFSSISGQNKNDIEKYTSQKPLYGFIENKGHIHDQDYKANPDVKYILCLGNGMNVQLKANSFSYDTYRTEIKEKEKDVLADKMRPNDEPEKDVTYYFHRVDVELLGANTNPQIIAEEPSAEYLNYYNSVTPESGATYVRNYKKITYKDIYPGIDMIFVAQPGKEKPVEYTFVVYPGADAGQIKLHYTGAYQTQLAENKINVDVAHGRFTESIPASWIKETNNKLNIAYRNIAKDIYSFDIPPYNQNQTLIIDPNPNLDWGTYYGGCSGYYDIAVTCDVNGNVLVTGVTSSTTGIATSGAHQATFGGNNDAFIAKFNNNGVRLWGTYFGGSGYEFSCGITCDASNNVFVTGQTSSNSGMVTSGAHQATYNGNYDSFLVKFNSNGVRQWSTYYGGSIDDCGLGITCDNSGNAYLTGQTRSTSAISTTGAQQTTLGGGYDNYIVKFNSSGVRQWGTYNGGAEDEVVNGISCDQHGYIIITGYTSSTSGIATSGAHQTIFAGGNFDAFVVKFSNSGIRQWGTYYGGTDYDMGNGISCDSIGNIYITGPTFSNSGIATSGSYQATFGGNHDAFLVKFNSNGVRQWGTYFGGNNYDIGNDIKSDINGNIFVTGATSSTSSISTSGAYQVTKGGDNDAFLAKFNSNGTLLFGTYYGGDSTDSGHGITCDESGNIFIIGYTKSLIGIATSGAHQTLFSGTDYEAFIAKFSCFIPSAPGPITGNSNVCQGEGPVTYSLPTISNATSYVWTLPSGATGSSSTNSINVNYGTSAISGNITVKGLNLCGEGTISTKQITVNPLPLSAGPISGSNLLCQGQTVTYSIPTIANATTYVWTLPSGATGNSTTNSITVNYGVNASSGNITVKGHNACGDGAISTKAITVDPLPSNAGTISGDTLICHGQNSATYTVPVIWNSTSYIWTLPPGAAGTSFTNSINVNFDSSPAPGNITVKGHNSCGYGASSSLYINLCCNNEPNSLITANSGSFTHGCNHRPYNNSSHCQWLIFPNAAESIYIKFPSSDFDIKEGDKIWIWDGPDTTSLLIGSYDNTSPPPAIIQTGVPMFVEFITDDTLEGNGFKAEYWTNISADISQISMIDNIKIYPNPANEEINIEFTTSESKMDLKIYNILGQSIYEKNITGINVKVKEAINVSKLPAGIYSVMLKSANSGKCISFVVE